MRDEEEEERRRQFNLDRQQKEQKANITTVLYYSVVYLTLSSNRQTNPSLSHLPLFNSMQR